MGGERVTRRGDRRSRCELRVMEAAVARGGDVPDPINTDCGLEEGKGFRDQEKRDERSSS